MRRRTSKVHGEEHCPRLRQQSRIGWAEACYGYVPRYRRCDAWHLDRDELFAHACSGLECNQVAMLMTII